MAENSGKVYLVGAGPGDPGLFTLKGVAALAQADVVLHDRLVSPELLAYAPATATIIEVGKKGHGVSTPQQHINELLATYALQGKTVVRLKGGDVSFFSNILDELATLTAHAIPYEIIPGVTAASGCAAYAGIPLTARGYSDEVHMYAIHNFEKFDFDALAKSNGTIVLYMSSANLANAAAQLVALGMPDKKLVVIEQGTTPHQQTHFGTIHTAATQWQGRQFTSPALVIIGSVVQLSDKYQWHTANQLTGQYFKETTNI